MLHVEKIGVYGHDQPYATIARLGFIVSYQVPHQSSSQCTLRLHAPTETHHEAYLGTSSSSIVRAQA
jgi:hypothetical protein